MSWLDVFLSGSSEDPALTSGTEAIKAVKLMSKRFTVHPDWEVTIALDVLAYVTREHFCELAFVEVISRWCDSLPFRT